MKSADFTQKKIFKLLFYTYCFGLIWELFYWAYLSISPEEFKIAFDNFFISDWLINYESGFVRRGLWGQIFYFLYDSFGVNVGYLVYFLSYFFLFVFLYIFIREWKRNNLSLFLLPSVCLIGAFAMSYLLLFRRDVLIFLLIWFILKSYRSFLLGNKKALCGVYLLSGIAILSHEASFFYFAPLLGLHFFFFQKGHDFWKIAFGKSLFFLLPIILLLLLCVIYKGDKSAAYNIWHSWDNYFISVFGYILPIGSGCKALGWDGLDTFKFHLRVNYIDTTCGIYRFCLWPFVFASVYYLLSQVNKIKIGMLDKNTSEDCFIAHVSQILVLQFIFLLPMFTVLSCDFRRVILYWSLSSFLICFGLGKDLLYIMCLGRLSRGIFLLNERISHSFWSNKYVYIFVFVFLGIPVWQFDINDAFSSTVLGNIKTMIGTLYSFMYGA